MRTHLNWPGLGRTYQPGEISWQAQRPNQRVSALSVWRRVTSVQDAARRAIEEHRQLELSVRDSEAFVEALLNPEPVNDRLQDTVRRYRETTDT